MFLTQQEHLRSIGWMKNFQHLISFLRVVHVVFSKARYASKVESNECAYILESIPVKLEGMEG